MNFWRSTQKWSPCLYYSNHEDTSTHNDSEASLSPYNVPSEEVATKSPYIDEVAGSCWYHGSSMIHEWQWWQRCYFNVVCIHGGEEFGAAKSASNSNKITCNRLWKKAQATATKPTETEAQVMMMTGRHHLILKARKAILAPMSVWMNRQATTFQMLVNFLWLNLPQPGCPDKAMDIHCFLCPAYNLQKKTIYSCVRCRKGFHITCLTAFQHCFNFVVGATSFCASVTLKWMTQQKLDSSCQNEHSDDGNDSNADWSNGTSKDNSMRTRKRSTQRMNMSRCYANIQSWSFYRRHEQKGFSKGLMRS